MLRFVIVTWGLVAAWLWWIYAPKSTAATVIGAVVLVAASITLGVLMTRRSRRLRGRDEFVNARLEYHSLGGRRHWRREKPARDDDGGRELTLGGGF